MRTKPNQTLINKAEDALREAFRQPPDDTVFHLVQNNDIYDVLFWYVRGSFVGDYVELPDSCTHLNAVATHLERALDTEVEFDKLYMPVSVCKSEGNECPDICAAKNAEEKDYSDYVCYFATDEHYKNSVDSYVDDVLGDFNQYSIKRVKEWSDLRFVYPSR